jgi:hypothetical protein
MAASKKIAVIWDVVPCSLIEIDGRFRGSYCLSHQGRCPHGGDSKYLSNFSHFLRDYTAQHSRQSYSVQIQFVGLSKSGNYC